MQCRRDGAVGTWLKLTLTKANGSMTTVAVTNQLADGTPGDLANALVSLINSSPGMQSVDGVIAEDAHADFLGMTGFNLRARSPGFRAAGVKVILSTSGGLALNPAATVTLTENLTDLQPRNHFYITAGATQLTARFTLNTTTLDDGWHDLTAVAYEGSHVRTQSRVQLPVRVQNTSLAATLTFVDMVATNSASGSYQIQVGANTNDISSIRAFQHWRRSCDRDKPICSDIQLAGLNLGCGTAFIFCGCAEWQRPALSYGNTNCEVCESLSRKSVTERLFREFNFLPFSRMKTKLRSHEPAIL